MTFGPDGDTGHLNHKGISDLVTEIIVRNQGWYEKYPLYYLAWPKEKEFWIPQGELTNLNYVDFSIAMFISNITKKTSLLFLSHYTVIKVSLHPRILIYG